LGDLIDAMIIDPVEESFIDADERGGLHDAVTTKAFLISRFPLQPHRKLVPVNQGRRQKEDSSELSP
jgi:hypothetical protein